MENRVYTPSMITSLSDNEIFVFGSNLAGRHIGGAARTAVNRFGAIMGQGVGLQGQCYAIPTMNLEIEAIKAYVNEFISFAKTRRDLRFLVTRIGCGIANFKEEDIAPLFAAAYNEPNIILPKRFCEIISRITHTDPLPELEAFQDMTIYQTPAGWFLNIHDPVCGEVDKEFKGKVIASKHYTDADLHAIHDGFFGSIYVLTDGRKKALFTVHKYHGMLGVCYKSVSNIPYKYDEIEIVADPWKKWWNIGFACCLHHGKWDLFKITQVDIAPGEIVRVEVLGEDYDRLEDVKAIIDQQPCPTRR